MRLFFVFVFDILRKTVDGLWYVVLLVLRAPFMMLGAVRTLCMIAFFSLGCVGVYNVPSVKKAVDPPLKKMMLVGSKKMPPSLKKAAKKAAVSAGIIDPPKGYLEIVFDKLLIIPSKLWDVVVVMATMTFERFLDFLFHPITILIGSLVLYLIYRKRGGDAAPQVVEAQTGVQTIPQQPL